MTIMIYFIFCCNFNAIIDIKSYICEKLEEWMMRQILLYVFILLVGSVSAEQFRITGKVVDVKGNEPMIGATVEIKGTDHRTATDIDGNFSIEVEKGAILKFSYCGCYSKEVEILTDSSLVIELEDKSPEDMTPEEIEKFMKIDVLRPYLEQKLDEIGENSGVSENVTVTKLNGRHLTNIGTFRAYCTAYLRRAVHGWYRELARRLEAPLELRYCR